MREGWTYKKLGEICKVITKGTTPTTIGYKFTDNGINFIKIECIDSNRNLIKENLTFISEECNNSMIRSQLQEKDLLFSIAGALGRIYIVEKSVLPANTNQALAIIRLSEKQDLFLLYLSYFLNSDTIKRQIEKDKVGVAQLNLSLGQIKDFIIPIPSIAEQQRIVSELDLLSSIIEKKKAQLKEYDQLAQSIFYDMFGDPVENEKGWEVKKLGEIGKLKSGDGLSAKDFVEGIYPVYGGNGISGYHNTYNMDGNYIVIGRVGAYCGNVRNVIGKFWLTDNAFQLLYDIDKHNSVFITHVLTYLNLHQYANHAAQPVISNITLKDIHVPLPPLSLQTLFAEKIEAIERQKALVQQSIVETQKLFDSRMDYYFN